MPRLLIVLSLLSLLTGCVSTTLPPPDVKPPTLPPPPATLMLEPQALQEIPAGQASDITVLNVVTGNYGICTITRTQLMGLQNWIKAVANPSM